MTINFFLKSILFNLCTLFFCTTCYSLAVDWDPDAFSIIEKTKPKPTRVAVLIIAPPRPYQDNFTEQRWALGQRTWEKYMNLVKEVDCYFVKTVVPKTEKADRVWLEGNTLYVEDPWLAEFGNDRILHKTIAALEHLLPNCTHFVRTNLNTFLNLYNVKKYMRRHHQSFFTGPIWEPYWYVTGYGIFFTADVARHMAKEYRRLEGTYSVNSDHADDCVLTSLATGIAPLDNSENEFKKHNKLPFKVKQLMSENCFSANQISDYGVILPSSITLDQAFDYCLNAPKTTMLYRIKEGLTLEELEILYNRLIEATYPSTVKK